jgi:exonuclease SbcD
MYPYSVSEAGQKKSITIVELGQKGQTVLRMLPFLPERTVRCLRGTLEELAASAAKQEGEVCRDYVSIILTEEETVESPKDYLEHYYDHILEIRIDNRRTRQILEEEAVDIRELTPLEAFEGFFCEVTGRAMNAQEEEVLQDILQELDDNRKARER